MLISERMNAGFGLEGFESFRLFQKGFVSPSPKNFGLESGFGFESPVNGYVAWKLKKMAYVSLSVNVTIINPKVAGFESKERLHSSEIKERQRDDHQPLFESKERLRSSEIKERQRGQRGDHQPLQSRWF